LPIDQVSRLPAALPFAYLLLRCDPVLQMRDQSFPRFSDLLVYSPTLDLGVSGTSFFLYANTILGPVDHLRTWPANVIGIPWVLGGALIFGVNWHFRSTHSRRLALSTVLCAYLYLLAYGLGDLHLTEILADQYAGGVPSSAPSSTPASHATGSGSEAPTPTAPTESKSSPPTTVTWPQWSRRSAQALT
jgi:hypothetical protein